MRFNLYLIIFLLFFENALTDDWNIINIEDNTKYFEIESYDSLNYIISGEFQQKIGNQIDWFTFIKKTKDAGKLWEFVWKNNFSIPDNIEVDKPFKLSMLTKDIIINGTEHGLILRTSNSGETWDTTNFGSNTKCNALSFYDKIHGAAFFSLTDYIAMSDDSGKSWSKISKPIIEDFDIN